MFQFHFLDIPDTWLDPARIREIQEIFSESVPFSQFGGVNISLLPDDEIHRLNQQYRGKDATTDVLSFHYHDAFEESHQDEIVAEIVMSESRILVQAEEHGHTPREEFETLLIHSLLHILGFDHETDSDFEDMWKYEKAIRSHMSL